MAGFGDPSWQAQMDQAKAGVADLAAIVRTYYDQLVEAGFRPDEALGLTMGFQASVLMGTQDGD